MNSIIVLDEKNFFYNVFKNTESTAVLQYSRELRASESEAALRILKSLEKK